MALPVTDFIVQRIHEYDPDIRVASGTGLYELMVAPLSIIMQPIRDEIDDLLASQTILQVLESVNPNSFNEDVVDSLLSNLRVSRRQGEIASTTVRVSFFSAQDFSATANSLRFLTGTNLIFTNSASVDVTQAQMSAAYDGFNFYIDIPCRALASGAGYNVPANAIAIMQSEPANVAGISNPNAVVGGITEETNLQYIERARDAISVRSLVSSPGISTTITEAFSGIREVSPTGFGDAEMMRDIISNIHVGGYVDAWMKPATTLRDVTYSLDPGLVADTTRILDGSELVNFYSSGATMTPIAAYPSYRTATDSLPAVQLSIETLTSTTSPDFSVKNQTGVVLYADAIDFSVTAAGLLSRPAATSRIAYVETPLTVGAPGNVSIQGAAGGSVKLVDNNIDFLAVNVSIGDRVVIHQETLGDNSFPDTYDGTYTVSSVTVNSIGLAEFGESAGSFMNTFAGGGYGYAIYGTALVTFKYNPVSIDINATVRADRENYTIANVPVLKIDSAEVLDSITGEPTGTIIPRSGGWGDGGFGMGAWGLGGVDGWSLYVVDPHTRFSAKEDLFIDFGADYIGQRVMVTYEYSPDIPSVDSYITSSANRIVAADILAKHTVPSFFNASITYEVDPANTTITTTNMLEAIEDLINTLGIGKTLELSDIVDLLYDNGVVHVALPIEAEISTHNTDGSVQVTPDEDELVVPTNLDDDPNNRPLSPRISHIIPGTITLTQNTA